MNKYAINKSEIKPGHWVCSDYENKIVCIFKDGDFHNTQVFEPLDDNPVDPMILAMVVREMTDWLQDYHVEKLFYNIREVFGKNLKKIRNEKGLTVRVLAALAQLNKSTIVNIEHGRFSSNIDVIYKISVALGVPIRDLFDF